MNRIESNRNENEMNPTPALFRPSVSRGASRTTPHPRTATRETFRRAVASRFAAPSRARVCRRAGNTAASGGETVPQTPACGTAAPDASVYTMCIDTFIIQYVSKIHIVFSIALVHTRARTPRRANARARPRRASAVTRWRSSTARPIPRPRNRARASPRRVWRRRTTRRRGGARAEGRRSARRRRTTTRRRRL